MSVDISFLTSVQYDVMVLLALHWTETIWRLGAGAPSDLPNAGPDVKIGELLMNSGMKYIIDVTRV